jgi:hypothetical protein
MATMDKVQSPTMNQRKRRFYEESSLVLGKICLRLGFKPNIITAASLVCSIVSGVYFWKHEMLWGVFWMVLTSFTDMLDGSTARAGNIGTVWGGILDHVTDRYAEFFILAGITLSGAVHPGWGGQRNSSSSSWALPLSTLSPWACGSAAAGCK